MRWSSKAFVVLRLGAVLFSFVGAVLWAIWSDSQQVRRATDQAAENVQLIEIYTDRLIQTQTILEEATLRHVEEQPPSYIFSEKFRDFLSSLENAQPASHGMAILASDGRVIAASEGFPADTPLALDDYRQAMAKGPRPFFDRIQRHADDDAFLIAMPFPLADGDGIFVSAIAVLSMRGFLQSIATGDGQAASLMREDGKLLVRNVPSRPMMLDPGTAGRKAISIGDDGTYRTVAVSDQVDRYYAFTRVGALPLFANFGTPVAAVRIAWIGQALPVWLFLAALGLFTYLLAGRIQRGVEDRLRQRATQAQLKAARQLAEQRAQLLQELNHRVKNNLAVIGSLISLQVRMTGKVDAEALKARLQAVVEVHSLLYRAQENDTIDLGQLLSRLAKSPAIVPPERGIAIESRLEDGILVGPDSAIPLALIVAELLTNTVKHAFPDGRPGSILIRLSREGDAARLDFSDDGVGAPVGNERKSGLRILDGLVAQAEATLTRHPGPGTHYSLSFPIRGMILPQLHRADPA